MQLPSPTHPPNWEPFKASCPRPVALGAEQRQPQASCQPPSCQLCPCGSTKKRSWEASGGFVSGFFLIFFISSANSRFLLFPGNTFFKTQICPTLPRKSLHFFPTATGCQQLYGEGAYRNPNSLRHPNAGATLWGGSHPALFPLLEFPVSKGEPCATGCCRGFALSPQYRALGILRQAMSILSHWRNDPK